MSISARLQSYLEEHHVPYSVITHHTRYTAQEIAAALHVPGKELAKVVVVKADDRYAMVVLPASSWIDLGALRRATGLEHAELATEGEMKRLFPDCETGAMPPFGNLYNLPVYVEKELTEDREIVFEAGSHHEAIQMAYRDYEDLVHPQTMHFRKAA